MNSKFFNPFALSLATSVLLLSVPRAFAQNVESQTSVQELQPLMFDVGSNGTQSLEQLKQSEAPTTPQSQSSQPSLMKQTDQVSSPLGGLFVTFLFITYILIGLQYRKHKTHRAAVLIQQIEMLERIWNMQSHR